MPSYFETNRWQALWNVVRLASPWMLFINQVQKSRMGAAGGASLQQYDLAYNSIEICSQRRCPHRLSPVPPRTWSHYCYCVLSVQKGLPRQLQCHLSGTICRNGKFLCDYPPAHERLGWPGGIKALRYLRNWTLKRPQDLRYKQVGKVVRSGPIWAGLLSSALSGFVPRLFTWPPQLPTTKLPYKDMSGCIKVVLPRRSVAISTREPIPITALV